MKWTVFDCEGDGLKPTKFHVLSFWDHHWNEPESYSDYKDMKEFLYDTEILVGHNIIRWDIPNLSRVLDIEIPNTTLIVDTLAVAWYLQPKRGVHNLDSYGPDYELSKPKVDNWNDLPYEVYRHRCETDVRINVALWKDQLAYLRKLYGSDEEVIRFLRYLQFKMRCAAEAEASGWLLDQDLARSTLEKFEGLQKEKFDELRQAMPPVPIVHVRTRPKNLRKANGEYSVQGNKWRELLESRQLPESHEGALEEVTGYDEPNPNSHDQIKRWLYGLGWKPQTFKKNKKKEQVPQINKPKQDGGGCCESIKLLYEKEPALEALDSLFVLGHRIGILRGFLDSVDDDGYVYARIQGLTNTLRFKHAEIVNIPKPDAKFGAELRACLIAPEGYELCGADMSSLEDRTKQHYMWRWDPEYVREMMTPDFDPHLDLAQSAGKLSAETVKQYKAGVYESATKTLRGIFKNTNYACTYGAFPPRIAETAGVSLSEGQELFDAYWKRNWSLKRIAESLRAKKIGEDSWLFNPVSGFWYSLRNEKDKFSTCNQSTGVYCFDIWLMFVLNRRNQLTAQFHDEGVWMIKRGHREEMTSILNEAIRDTNDYLELNRQLDIGIAFGDNYATIH